MRKARNLFYEQLLDASNAPLSGVPDASGSKSHVWRATSNFVIKSEDAPDGVSLGAFYPHPSAMMVRERNSTPADRTASLGFVNSPHDTNTYRLSNSTSHEYQSNPRAFNVRSGLTGSLWGNANFLSTETPENWETLRSGTGYFPAYALGKHEAGTTHDVQLTITVYGYVSTMIAVYVRFWDVDAVTGEAKIISTALFNGGAVLASGTLYTATSAALASAANLYAETVFTCEDTRSVQTIDMSFNNVRAVQELTQAEDYATLSQLLDRVRCVGMRVLISNINPDLTNGGEIAIAPFPPETSNTELDALCVALSDVTTAPGMYSGPLKNGCAGFVQPSDPVAWQLYRPTVLSLQELITLPSLQYAIAWQPGVEQSVRIRIDAIFEASTSAQILGPQPSRIAPHELDTAFGLIQSSPCCTSNDLHSQIVGIYKRLAEKVSESAPTAVKVGQFALAAGKALAPLVATLV